nr:MAG TPA: hypothetical protein [Caudoviricetes sp.]
MPLDPCIKYSTEAAFCQPVSGRVRHEKSQWRRGFDP